MSEKKDTVEVDREVLSNLRHFADRCAPKQGTLEAYSAILEAGLALQLYDPTPSVPLDRIDTESWRTQDRYQDNTIDEFIKQYHQHSIPVANDKDTASE